MDIWFALINLEHKEEIRKPKRWEQRQRPRARWCAGDCQRGVCRCPPEAHSSPSREDVRRLQGRRASRVSLRRRRKEAQEQQAGLVGVRAVSAPVKEDVEEASEALQKGLKCLAAHKHLFVISRYAQDEFEGGSVERGRTIFEELTASYGAKRVDLWNVYIDKEVKVESSTPLGICSADSRR